MPALDCIFQGDPNAPIEASFPQTPGSTDNPQLLCWTARRLLYINVGGSWSPLAQLSPDQVIQQLGPPLLATVIQKLQAEPHNSPLDASFARVLARGY